VRAPAVRWSRSATSSLRVIWPPGPRSSRDGAPVASYSGQTRKRGGTVVSIVCTAWVDSVNVPRTDARARTPCTVPVPGVSTRRSRMGRRTGHGRPCTVRPVSVRACVRARGWLARQTSSGTSAWRRIQRSSEGQRVGYGGARVVSNLWYPAWESVARSVDRTRCTPVVGSSDRGGQRLCWGER
jgi:hypothetical protein